MEWDKRLPFFDFVFMRLMEELGIKNIISFDGHFDLKRLYSGQHKILFSFKKKFSF